MSRDAYDGIVIMETAQQRAEEVIRWARNNKRVWRFLVRMLNATDLGNMILGHSWLLIAVVLHHRGMGNHPLLHFRGLSEQQVLSRWQAGQEQAASYAEAMNGNMPDGTTGEFSGVNS